MKNPPNETKNRSLWEKSKTRKETEKTEQPKIVKINAILTIRGERSF